MYTDIIIQILYLRLKDSTEQDGALKVNDSIFKNSVCFIPCKFMITFESKRIGFKTDE